MEKQYILEGNKLIAEFMGAEIIESLNSIHLAKFTDAPAGNKKYTRFELNFLKYHSSWDWLMPVKFKVESMPHENSWSGHPFEIKLRENYAEIDSDEGMGNKGGGGPFNLFVKDNSPIENLFKVIVEFIKWYNQDDKKIKPV